MTENVLPVEYRDADDAMRSALVKKLNVPGRHRLSERTIHIGEDGFTIVAMVGGEAVGVISICWKQLPGVHAGTMEAYIDLIDVDPGYRRRGIARRLIEQAAARARERGVYQIRGWTSESREREAAIGMWRGLGYAICPTEIVVGKDATRVKGCFAVRRLVDG